MELFNNNHIVKQYSVPYENCDEVIGTLDFFEEFNQANKQLCDYAENKLNLFD